jgi:hypothetical protein
MGFAIPPLPALIALASKIPSLPKIPGVAAPALPTTDGPNYSDALKSIKDGSAMAGASASLDKVTSMSSSLPASMAEGLNAAKAAVAASMAAAQATMGRDMSIAKANIDLQNKIAIAETGKPATDAQVASAMGPLQILKDGPKMLADQAKSIATSIGGFASSFGVSAPAGADPTALATAAGGAAASFSASVPAATIPDPQNPGQTIPNPAYTAFTAVPGNSSKLTALGGLGTAVSGAASSLSGSLDAAKATAAASLSSAVTDLKASSLAAKLSAPMPAIMSSVVAGSVDTSKIDPMAAAKAAAIASAKQAAPAPKDEKMQVSEAKDTAISSPGTIPKDNEKDKVYKSEVLSYYNDYVIPANESMNKAKDAVSALPLYSVHMANKEAKNKVKAEQPDPALYTDEQKAIVATYEKSLAEITVLPLAVAYIDAIKLKNKYANDYNNFVYKAWETEASRNFVPAEIRQRLSLEALYQSVTKNAKA